MLGKTRRVHFVGIGGIGMSGIAELLANLGYVVSGSDEKRSAVTDRLATLGIRVGVRARAPRTSATRTSWWSRRPCGRRTRRSSRPARRQIPVIPRAEMLAELMRLRYAIAVAGAHGKTTTTSMIALVLERAGLDPTAVIGGRLSAFGSNARLGRGELMVAEADESDRSFLKLFPTIAVITNIDHEHLENYGGFDDLQQAFVDFANKVPFYGAVIACADDPNAGGGAAAHDAARDHVRPRRAGRRRHGDATSRLEPLGVTRDRRTARAARGRSGRAARRRSGPLTLQRARPAQPAERAGGRRRRPRARPVLRADRGRPARSSAAPSGGSRSAASRTASSSSTTTAIIRPRSPRCSPRPVRSSRRIVVAFQPHRFTRTAALMDAFGPALAGADHIVLTDIYAAGEDPIPGVTLDALADAVRRSVTVPVDVVPRARRRRAGARCAIARPGDVVITLGAGSIGTRAGRS